MDSGVLVEVGARVGVEAAVGSTGLAVARGRAGAAWAGSVGLIACVAVGRTSVGGAATQAARRAAASSRDPWATSSDRRLTVGILWPTIRSVNSRVGKPAGPDADPRRRPAGGSVADGRCEIRLVR